MSNDRRDTIAKRAYEIWEREGRPQGREAEHWQQAEAELAAKGPAPAKKWSQAKAKSKAKPATKGSGGKAETKKKTPKGKAAGKAKG